MFSVAIFLKTTERGRDALSSSGGSHSKPSLRLSRRSKFASLLLICLGSSGSPTATASQCLQRFIQYDSDGEFRPSICRPLEPSLRPLKWRIAVGGLRNSALSVMGGAIDQLYASQNSTSFATVICCREPPTQIAEASYVGLQAPNKHVISHH